MQYGLWTDHRNLFVLFHLISGSRVMRVFLQALFATIVFVFVSISTAQSQTYYYLTVVDEDGDTQTGCSVEINDNSGLQIMSGVDLLLLATVNSGALASIQTAPCSGQTITSTNINTALNWQNDATHPTYTLSSAFIEYRLPAGITINSNTAVGFASSTSQNFSTSNDVLFTSGGSSILLSPLLTRAAGVSIPWASPIILLLIALTLGVLGARFLRHPRAHRLGVFALFLCVISLSSAVYSALRITLDGAGTGWSNATLLASGAAGNVSPGEIDLSHVYGALQDNQLHFKLHVVKQPKELQIPVPAVAEFRLLGADISEPNEQSTIIASGDQDRIRGAAKQVHIRNITTNIETTATLASGQWQTQIAAKAGDQLELTPINNNDEAGGPIYLQVQGTTQESTLPPDPINDPDVASELNPQDVYTVFDSTKFLYTNTPPIQIGVDPDTIQPKFSSLIVGKVLKRDNAPLSGVTVKIKDHDEYGHTLTREDGQLDMVVNGGQWFVVEYSKEGYLPVQRKVQVAWQDYGYLPDVVMIPVDHKVSVIDLRELRDSTKHASTTITDNATLGGATQKEDTEAPYFLVHQGTINTDEDGARRATILFPRDTEATIHLPDGTTQALDVLNVRATEYTIGENGPNAMPGELPANVGYTYAVELSIDQAIQLGATKVEFNQPLPMYVENFLDFPVGEAVPLGWYSYDQKAWVPDNNGRVIKVIRIENNTAILNVTGKEGISTDAELAELGITLEEQKEIAKLYQANDTFWRVTVMHFTPWDCNWPYGPPECDSSSFQCAPPDDETPDDLPPDPEDDCEAGGCTIQTTSRTMIENVPVAGTPFSLTYATSRAPGYVSKTPQIRRYLRGQKALKSSIIRVEMEVRVLGRSIIVFSGPPEDIKPWQIEMFVWDGKDRYGRVSSNTVVTADHIVRYVVPAVYYASSSSLNRAFAQYGGASMAITRMGITNSINVSNWRISHLASPNNAINPDRAWTLSDHHFYDMVHKKLYLGSGAVSTEKGVFRPRTVKTLFNGETNCFVQSWDLLPTGNLLIVGYRCSESLIFEWDVKNKMKIDWKINSSYDIEHFRHVRIDPMNNGVYLVDTKNRIFYRASNGDLTHLAGKSEGAENNDMEADPFDVNFSTISDMLPGKDGELYIADEYRGCIQKLDVDRKIRTVLGECGRGNAYPISINEPTLFTFMRFYSYSSLALMQDKDGDVYISDAYRKQVLKVGRDGFVEPYIGVGNQLSIPDCFDQRLSIVPLSLCVMPYSGVFSKSGEFYLYAGAYTFTDSSYYQMPIIYKHDLVGEIRIDVGNTEKLAGNLNEEESALVETTNPLLTDLELLNYGTLRINDHDELYYRSSSRQINVISPPFTKFDGSDIMIADSSGKQLFLFDAYGYHLETQDALTGATIYRFAYDANHKLVSVTDHDGKVTRIERNGNQQTIIGPYGHKTEITLQQDGLISRLQNPDGKAWQFSYDLNGLMLQATNPNEQSNKYSYDEYGRLISDIWPNNGGWTLAEENLGQSLRLTTMTSGEGRITQYTSNKDDLSYKKVARPDGSVFERQKEYANLIKKNTLGTEAITVTGTEEGDPRFGGAASYYSKNVTSLNKDARTNQIKTRRWVELIDDDTLLPVSKWGEEVYDNSTKASSVVYDHAQMAWTMASPSGITMKADVDAIHRPLKVTTPDGLTTRFSYDQGLLAKIEVQPETGDSRIWQSTYNEQGLVSEQFDPLNRKTAFAYDAVGHITSKTLPDGRTIQFSYDAMGNMLGLVTPAGETHRFVYDVMGDTSGYTPPQDQNTTTYHYDKERNLSQVSLPDASQIVFHRDPVSGRLISQTYSGGSRTVAYGSNGKVSTITEGDNKLHALYDGLYHGGQRWEGDVNGTVNFFHDANAQGFSKGLITRLSVTNDQETALYQKFTYGLDDELTSISINQTGWNSSFNTITFQRDPATLRLNSVQGWMAKDRDQRTYNAFGEITGYDYQRNVLQEYADYVLTDFSAVLSGHDEPVDYLTISGKLDTPVSGRLRMELESDEDAVGYYHHINVNENGEIIPFDLKLSAQSGQEQYYWISGDGDDEPTRKYRIGPLVKKEPVRFSLHELAAINPNFLYSEKFVSSYTQEDDPELCLLPLDENEFCPPHHQVTRIDLQTHESVTFVLDEQGAYVDGLYYPEFGGIWYGDSAKVVGSVNDGVYVHHRFGYALCGEDEEGRPLDCLTLQKPGQAPEKIMTLPVSMGGNSTEFEIRAVNERPGEFYVVYDALFTGEYDHMGELMIEYWKVTGNEVTKTPLTRIPNDLSAPNSHYTLDSAGQDLLIARSTPINGYGNIQTYYRVTPGGVVRRIQKETNNYEWVNGVFGDEQYTCYMFKDYNIEGPVMQRFACLDENNHEVKNGVLPYDIASGLPRPWLTPKLDQAAGDLYLSYQSDEDTSQIWSKGIRKLWRKQQAVTSDFDWEEIIKKEQPVKAQLTVTGGTLTGTHHEIATEYGIHVERDALGRVTQKTENTQDGETTQQYQYDEAGRLVKVTTNGTEETYTYDANGNRTHKNGQAIATFDAQDKILQQNGTTYQHNQLGQRIQKNAGGQITAYHYDVFGGLKNVTLPDNTQIDYVLDPTGRRIGRKENGSWSHKWLYQDGLNPIAELDENDQIRKLFIYADKPHVPAYMIQYNESGSVMTRYRIVSDLLGSVRLVYDLATGNEVQRIDYDVWGNITSDTNPGFQPFGFAGGLYDNQTKLTRFGARDYDAETARWTAKDPILFNGGDTNLYGYVLNDPVNWIDPKGENPLLIGAVIIGGLIFIADTIDLGEKWSNFFKNDSNLENVKDKVGDNISNHGDINDLLKLLEEEQKAKQKAICDLTDAIGETMEYGASRATGGVASSAASKLPPRVKKAYDAYEISSGVNELHERAQNKK